MFYIGDHANLLKVIGTGSNGRNDTEISGSNAGLADNHNLYTIDVVSVVHSHNSQDRPEGPLRGP